MSQCRLSSKRLHDPIFPKYPHAPKIDDWLFFLALLDRSLANIA